MPVVDQDAPPSGNALAAALARPESYPQRPDVVEVRETHISWVFLAGDRAYKLKKPVTLPFVDYGTPDRRRAMCEEEVRLNRRLAHDLYLGVRAVVATPEGGARLAPAGDPDAIDHVVEMQRFDETRTLAALVARGSVSDGHGDLRAEHLLLERGVEVVDCVEFDPALRVADAGCDLAFLTMDLDALGAFEAARSVLARYRAAGGDPGDDELVAFFARYRPLVRAKVALIRADQSADPSRLVAGARSLLTLPERLAWRARRPGLVVVAGLSASGRPNSPRCSPPVPACAISTPTAFASVSWASRRARGSARPPTARASTAAPTRSSAGSRSASCSARPACSSTRRSGALGDLPAGSVVECRAPVSVRLERARRRAGDAAAVSDADADVVRLQADDGGVGADVPAGHHVVLRTDRPAADALDDSTALLDARLARAIPSPSTHPSQRGPS